jgi:hypothetical protein
MTEDIQTEISIHNSAPNSMRLAVVLDPKLEAGASANAAAIVIGGLRCEAFESAFPDAEGNSHVAIKWNLVVLKARSAPQLKKLLLSARELPVSAVVFTAQGQELSNKFDFYKEEIGQRSIDEMEIVAVGLYGSDTDIRLLTRPFSLLK